MRSPDTNATIANSNIAAAAVTAKEKIKSLDNLCRILDQERKTNKRIVLCHGVFDLMHIGHIRHFEEAKKNGDILVVTLTPDIYVNKGPHRPVFPEMLRAETLAALHCVDYVAINNTPMAIDLIKILRPNFYVKGKEYQKDEDDITGGIILEREAVESVGGKLVFTDDIVFSSSNLINRHWPVFSPELSAYLAKFGMLHSAGEINGYFEKMRPLKVLTIGEAIIDEYIYCSAIGKSSKEPMLAVKCSSSEKFAGGILAVANNMASFSDNVSILSFLGDRESHEDFIRERLKENINTIFLTRNNSPTIVKKRFIESYFFHKLLAVYTINDSELEQADDELLCTKLSEIIPEFDIVVVVDFGHSVISKQAAKVICDKAKFLAVNTQSNAGSLGYQTIYKYSRADYVCITENEFRLETRSRVGDIKDAVPQLATDLKAKHVVITRGKNGCLCYGGEEGFVEVPAMAGEVIDRMGAGDSFLSVTSMAAAIKAPLEVIGFIGNAVGAQAVATVGHRESINKVSLSKFITSLLQ